MRNFDFSPLYRSSIGFDRLFNILDTKQNETNDVYPPYNVELVDENHYHITIAVAGFTQKELEITSQENILLIKGIYNKEQKKPQYLYEGITQRNFECKFQLAKNIVVRDAHLDNGLLQIDLERLLPETAKPNRIEIFK